MAAFCVRLAGKQILRNVPSRSFLNRTSNYPVHIATCHVTTYNTYFNVNKCEDEGLQNTSNICRQVRFYSKSKSKGEKKKKGPVPVNEQEISEVLDVDDLKNDLNNAFEHMKAEYVKNLSLRSSSGAIDNLMIPFEGENYPLQEIVTVGRKSPQMMVVNLAALPQVIPSVLKAIRESGMGLNPQQDGTTIYIPVPKVTREHREQLAKNAKVLFNKFKETIRDIQNRHIRKLKKQEDTVSADLIFSVQNQIHTLAENIIQDAEKVMIAKQSELLGMKE